MKSNLFVKIDTELEFKCPVCNSQIACEYATMTLTFYDENGVARVEKFADNKKFLCSKCKKDLTNIIDEDEDNNLSINPCKLYLEQL